MGFFTSTRLMLPLSLVRFGKHGVPGARTRISSPLLPPLLPTDQTYTNVHANRLRRRWRQALRITTAGQAQPTASTKHSHHISNPVPHSSLLGPSHFHSGSTVSLGIYTYTRFIYMYCCHDSLMSSPSSRPQSSEKRKALGCLILPGKCKIRYSRCLRRHTNVSIE